MNNHTPEPWKAVYVGCSDWDLSGPVTEQDWKLAAAAPDLLQALTLLVAGIENSVSDTYIPLVKARAAIAKATGGQS
jgi:hypothetical protein